MMRRMNCAAGLTSFIVLNQYYMGDIAPQYAQ
jgi:hypothetical protein